MQLWYDHVCMERQLLPLHSPVRAVLIYQARQTPAPEDCAVWQTTDLPFVSQSDVWKFFEEASSFGREVYTR